MNRYITPTQRRASCGIALTLILSLLLLVPLVPSSGKDVAATTSANTTTPLPNTANNKIKTLRGEGLKARAEQVRIKNKGLDRAMKEFAKRKRTPRWELSLGVQKVTETSAVNREELFLQKASYSPQTYSDGDREIDFITYSGDYDAWEGIVYIHTPSEDETYSADVLTPTDDGTNWDLVNEVYYPPDGGDPDCAHGGDCLISDLRPAHKHKGNQKTAMFSHHGASPHPGFFGRLKRWWGCVSNGCGWSGFICTGWSRFFCEVGICTALVFYCL